MRRIMLALLTGAVTVAGAGHHAGALDSETIIRKTALGAGEGRATIPVHGLTSAPPGYVALCRRDPSACAPQSSATSAARSSERIVLTAERWIMLMAVNGYINDKVAPRTDRDLYGVEEHWTLPGEAGDCEDYVLLKRRELIARGWPESALLITVVLDEAGEGHAVLTVRTAQGDYILDNKHSRILHWRETRYTFIKRQSYRSPDQWVSLAPQPGQPSVAAASAWGR